jgi:hypothetical protein
MHGDLYGVSGMCRCDWLMMRCSQCQMTGRRNRGVEGFKCAVQHVIVYKFTYYSVPRTVLQCTRTYLLSGDDVYSFIGKSDLLDF